MSKLKDHILYIQEQVWEFFDKKGNFVPKEVSFDNKMQTIQNKTEMVNMFAIEHGLMAKQIAEEEVFAIEASDHFSQ